MVVCKVVGHVWATKKEPSLEGLKLMLVQEDTGSGKAPIQVAADVVGAGIGERVLVVSGSTGAQGLRPRRRADGYGNRRHHRQHGAQVSVPKKK